MAGRAGSAAGGGLGIVQPAEAWLTRYLEHQQDKIWLWFYPPARVVPGQPLLVEWRLFAFTDQYDLGSGYRIRLLLGDQEIAHFPDDFTQWLPYATPGDSGMVLQHVAALPPDDDLGVALYTIGTQTLTIEATTNSEANPGPFRTDAALVVVPENVNASWWKWPQWQSPYQELGPLGSSEVGPDLLWKQPYDVTGLFTNYSQYVKMHIESVLVEQDRTVGVAAVDRNYPPEDVDKQRPQGMASSVTLNLEAQLTQSWTWIWKTAWFPEGPFDKELDYTAVFTLTDAYENEYPPVTSVPITFSFTIADSKLYWAEAAFAAKILASALSWIPYVGKALGWAADALGAQALDPPPPDPTFLQVARPTVADLPAGGKAIQSLAPVRRFLEQVAAVLGTTSALTVTEGRLLGARQASSQKGIDLQSRTYRETIARLVREARLLPALAEAAVTALEADATLVRKVRASFAKNAAARKIREPGTALRIVTMGVVAGAYSLQNAAPTVLGEAARPRRGLHAERASGRAPARRKARSAVARRPKAGRRRR